MQPYNDSTAIAADGAELARRMERDGYLFIRGLLPAAIVEDLRLKFLAIARDSGWVKTDAPLAEAIADQNGFCVEPEPNYMERYGKMYLLPEFHAMQHRPELLELLERMCGEPVMPHPRLIGRTIFPQREAFTTPPHQDFIPIQGTAATYTAWFPLSDLLPGMGGLQVAEGSHQRGVYDFRPSLGAGGIEITESFEDAWRGNPLSQGDVIFFHSMAVHQGVPNTSASLRLSIDARFQKISDPLDAGSLLPHTRPQTWEEIYADWPADNELKYYWKKWDLQIVEYDNSYHQRRDETGLAMAAQGDPQSRSTLQRIIARDPDPTKRQRAQELLDSLEEAVG